MYLPCWTDGLTWQDKHFCYLIDIDVRSAKDYSLYSLLPVRYAGDFKSLDGAPFYSCDRSDSGAEIHREFRLCNSLDYYSSVLWEKSAELILKEFQDIEKIRFGKQGFDGVYPIEFRYPVALIEKRQKEIMQELIDGGFSIDESIRTSVEENGKVKTIRYFCVADLTYREAERIFNSTPCGQDPPIELRKNISYSYEACSNDFLTFSERLLECGNQRRCYRERNKDLNAAIKGKRLDEVKRLIRKGDSLNEISKDGESVFTAIVKYCMDIYDGITDRDIEYLDELVEMGANPGVFGGFEDDLLTVAITHRQNLLVKWLLDKGVNPNQHPFPDDAFEASTTLLDWVYSLDNELYLDDDPEEAHRINLEQIALLEAHGAKFGSRILLTENSFMLYDLMWTLTPDFDAIRQLIEQNRMTPEEITRTAIRFVEDAAWEDLDCPQLNDNIVRRPLFVESLHSACLYDLIRLLLDYGLEPNAVYNEDNLIEQVVKIINADQAADTLALLLENGGDVNVTVKDERVFDSLEFDVFFGRHEMPGRRNYDALVHCWMVFIGYGVKASNGRCPVDSVYRPDQNEEFGIKDFELSDLKVHKDFAFCISNMPSNGESYTIHIFDNRTKWEVARV